MTPREAFVKHVLEPYSEERFRLPLGLIPPPKTVEEEVQRTLSDRFWQNVERVIVQGN